MDPVSTIWPPTADPAGHLAEFHDLLSDSIRVGGAGVSRRVVLARPCPLPRHGVPDTGATAGGLEGCSPQRPARDPLADGQEPGNKELVIAVVASHGPQEQEIQKESLPSCDLTEIGLIGPAARAFHGTVPRKSGFISDSAPVARPVNVFENRGQWINCRGLFRRAARCRNRCSRLSESLSAKATHTP